MKIVLISTYELGRQPFGLASPVAWLRSAGHSAQCLDLSREALNEAAIRAADLIAFYVPMHTATRLATGLLAPVQGLNPGAHICFYGLYAPVNEAYLRGLGADTILGGEFEEGLAHLAARLQEDATAIDSRRPQPEPVISLARQRFILPDRAGMPGLEKYAHVVMPDGQRRIAGSTEATRGCKHRCRHCPIVPVYNGAFRVVERDVVLEDIRQQLAAGARHITFGDPDFWNAPTHALSIVEALHREFPGLSYDVTIKIEHLRKYDARLAGLRDTGCLFVTSAVEAVEDGVLEKLDKGHSRADFIVVASRFRELGMTLLPTFVPFTPWTTLEGFNDLLDLIAQQELFENVAPIQLAIRLLIPAGSRLLELPEVREEVGPFDSAALLFPWKHKDPRVDQLCHEVLELARRGEQRKLSRTEIFWGIRHAARAAAGFQDEPETVRSRKPQPVPFLDEPWYCCAEPTQDQFVSLGKVEKSFGKTEQFV